MNAELVVFGMATLHCPHSAAPCSFCGSLLLMAEFDEVATGERTSGLLQAATRRETAEIYRGEAETSRLRRNG